MNSCGQEARTQLVDALIRPHPLWPKAALQEVEPCECHREVGLRVVASSHELRSTSDGPQLSRQGASARQEINANRPENFPISNETTFQLSIHQKNKGCKMQSGHKQCACRSLLASFRIPGATLTSTSSPAAAAACGTSTSSAFSVITPRANLDHGLCTYTFEPVAMIKNTLQNLQICQVSESKDVHVTSCQSFLHLSNLPKPSKPFKITLGLQARLDEEVRDRIDPWP